MKKENKLLLSPFYFSTNKNEPRGIFHYILLHQNVLALEEESLSNASESDLSPEHIPRHHNTASCRQQLMGILTAI